jgi:hypothetical protein
MSTSRHAQPRPSCLFPLGWPVCSVCETNRPSTGLAVPASLRATGSPGALRRRTSYRRRSRRRRSRGTEREKMAGTSYWFTAPAAGAVGSDSRAGAVRLGSRSDDRSTPAARRADRSRVANAFHRSVRRIAYRRWCTATARAIAFPSLQSIAALPITGRLPFQRPVKPKSVVRR